MKKYFVLSTFLSIAVFAASISGCELQTFSEEEKIHISFSFWEPSVDNSLENGLETVINNYNKIHPEVEIELISEPVSGYQEWIKEQYAANSAPTIESNHTTSIISHYKQGLTYNFKADLDKVNEYDGVIWRDDFIDEKLDRAGDGISIPWFDLGVAYYYNKNIYRELNLRVPTTWNEFMENCEKIEQSGKNPIALMAQKKDAIIWLKMYLEEGLASKAVMQNSEVDKNDDGTVSGEELYEAVVSGAFDVSKGENRNILKNLLKEFKRYGDYAHNAVELDESEAKQEFLTGNAAHIMSGSWDMQGFAHNKSDSVEIGAFSLPRFTKENTDYPGDIPFIGGTQSLTVSNSASEDQKAAAVDFLKFLFSKEQYGIFYETTMQMPTMKGFDSAEEYEAFRATGRVVDSYYIIDNGNGALGFLIKILSDADLDYDEMIDEIQKQNYECAAVSKQQSQMN
ncbi:MAG: ABC transporter substrate-binding protein [Clostridiales bacterium]|nr:ABC transporter substrate-binding protein [Clostridiales bacterium]